MNVNRVMCEHGSYRIPGEPQQCLRCRIALLEAVAEAAVAVRTAEFNTCSGKEAILDDALRAAGYLAPQLPATAPPASIPPSAGQ